MVVVARTDPHAVHQDVFDAHPDWIAVEANGQKRRHWAMPELWVTCALGPYNFQFMTEVTKEIVTRYQVDGLFSNRWAGSGMCYCEHCRENFHAAAAMDLPRTNDPHNPARRAYLAWRQQRLFELWRLWDTEIRRINPSSCYIPNCGGGALSDLDMKTVGSLAPILFADRQARSGLMAPWANGKNAKEYRSTMGNKPVGGIFSVGVEEPYRWKDSVQDGAEIRLWALDGIANGIRPWFTKFSGTLYDRRWLPVVEDLYGWHYRNQNYLRHERSLARVGLVYSQRTAQLYGGERARQKVEDHTLGYYQALIEARIPFEMVHDQLLDAEHTAAFQVLILPNIAVLSDEQCAEIRAFVARGGGVVATYETSLYDENGERRPNFGLADLFGASFDGALDARMQNSYLRLETDPRAGHRHPILAGLDDTERIINGVSRVHTRSTGDTYAPLTLIPSYPDLPMEEVFPRVPKTDIPEAARPPGRSRPRGVFPLGHRPHLLGNSLLRPRQAPAQRRRLGGQRAAPGHRHRPRRARCSRVAAERLHDRPPGQPDESHDDEGTAARVHSHAAAESFRAPARRQPRQEGAAIGQRATPARDGKQRHVEPEHPKHRGSRSGSHRSALTSSRRLNKTRGTTRNTSQGIPGCALAREQPKQGSQPRDWAQSPALSPRGN